MVNKRGLGRIPQPRVVAVDLIRIEIMPAAPPFSGRLLVDIHGQSEHLSLLDTKSHLDFLDSYAHTLDLRHSFNIKAT